MLRGGALKPTSTGRWAHLVCAVSIPEVLLQNSTTKEPVLTTDIPRSRKKLVSSLPVVHIKPPVSGPSLSPAALLHVSVCDDECDARSGGVCAVCP